MAKLHILNGDAALRNFEATEIEGDILVWREMLCEGPTLSDLNSPKFWEMRREFLATIVPADSIPDQKLEDEFQRIRKNLADYSEITLWFEYDLFCQINLLAAASWVRETPKAAVYLVCAGDEPDYDKLVGLGEIRAADMLRLFEGRVELTSEDLNYLHELWAFYSEGEHAKLLRKIEALVLNTERLAKFPHLLPAFDAHCGRFPNAQTGLNAIETKILEQIERSAPTRRQLIGQLLRSQGYLGFGDLQYEIYLEDLGQLWQDKAGQLTLTPTGEQVLKGRANFTALRKRATIFGGAGINKYFWDGNTLVPSGLS